MAVKKRGLGRGLDALLASASVSSLQEQASNATENELQQLELDAIQPGKYQPRKDMDPTALEELALSIKAQGLLQPIVVRPIANNKHEIIAGERRWRAARQAGMTQIPALVRNIEDEAAVALALIENIQREDLNPIEEATALQQLQQEFELTQQQIADAVGKSRATVANLLRLINLPEEVKTLLAHGDIEMGHARALLALPQQQQALAARHVAALNMTVRQTESYVRNLLNPQSAKTEKPVDPDISRLENKLAEKLGAAVKIKHGNKGKGQLIIRYSNLEELQGVLAHIK